MIFRRLGEEDEVTGVQSYFYATHFAIVDVAASRYETNTEIDRRAAPSMHVRTPRVTVTVRACV